jgi:hypothetical protein
MGGPVSHDVWRTVSGADISPGSSGGAAASTAVFGTETFAVRLLALGPVSSVAGAAGVRYKVIEGASADVVSSTADTLLPLNWDEYIKVAPGQRISAIGNDAGASYKLSVTELTD